MNLLPASHEEFSQPAYWDQFFKKRGNKAFEWYGEYVELCDQIYKYAKCNDKILMLGCGNSRLSINMHAQGYRDITNVDISPVAINRMMELCKSKNIDMIFEQMDVTAMTYADASFSVAFDKGTLDALFSDDSAVVRANVERYFKEVSRVLRPGGRYLCVSLLQEHILNYLIDFFPRHSFMVRIVHCQGAHCYEKVISGPGNETLPMPVFMVIATKFRTLPMPILEFSLGVEKMQRMSNAKELVNAVTSLQRATLVCNGLSRCSIDEHKEVQLDLHKTGGDTTTMPRYTVHILDQPYAEGLGRYAAFIVPQGREIEWLFATPEGRRKLQQSAHYERLAIVTLHRNQVYVSLDDVKSELADSVRMLSPLNSKGGQIPYLSLGTDVGKRETLVSGCSQISGEFRIEEVEHDKGKLLRRLIFLSNQLVVQSEALVKTIKPKGKPERKKIDIGYLACQHHLYMAVGVQMVATRQVLQQRNVAARQSSEFKVLVVGLGGGGLCSFLHEAFPKIHVTAVEIDPIMLEVAIEYFDLKQDKRLHVVIDDGLGFLERCKQEEIQFDAVLFDVDSKDLTLGMSCPPRDFLAASVLGNVKKALRPYGLFILNLVCRDETLRAQALDALHLVFVTIGSYKLAEDINEVIYCGSDSVEQQKQQWYKAAHSLSDVLTERKLTSADILDVAEFLNDFKLI